MSRYAIFDASSRILLLLQLQLLLFAGQLVETNRLGELVVAGVVVEVVHVGLAHDLLQRRCLKRLDMVLPKEK